MNEHGVSGPVSVEKRPQIKFALSRSSQPSLRSYGGQVAISGVLIGRFTQGGALPESRSALGYYWPSSQGFQFEASPKNSVEIIL